VTPVVGRALLSEKAASRGGFHSPAHARRRAVLRETLDAFADAEPPDHFHRLAEANLRRWRETALPQPTTLTLRVLPGDWGEVTAAMTKNHGQTFAVLNMANAFVPGGGYVEGAIAQEENLFRRTDAHFHITEEEYDGDRYRPAMTALLSARNGEIYLDTQTPRVCIRGPEDRSADDLGYRWLADDEVFSFYELRAAAQDLRDGSPFDPDEARRRIAAQFATLERLGIRCAVLSAFGCGAFRNPADQVARLYRDEITARAARFDVIAFAIFAPGYGPDNYTPFAAVLTNTSAGDGG
jgi:hypothetical protein